MFAASQEGFQSRLSTFIENETVKVADYPQLQLLCWNRRDAFVTAREAWERYERNWRFVSRERLEPREQELIRTLSSRFGDEVVRA